MKKPLMICLLLASMLLTARETVVKVSDFHPDPKDATAAIQAALDSGATKVIVDKLPFDYLITTVFLRSNQEVVVQDGVTIAAIPGEHKDVNSCLVAAVGVKNGILRGEGTALLKMNKADYQDPNKYARSEHRHLMPIINCKNFTVRDITLSSSGGDGLYISGKDGDVSSDILIENVVSDNHHRQGCSVISAERLTIRKCRFVNTSGTPPALGIDFEPNNSTERLVDCLVEDCYLGGNVGGGLDMVIFVTLAKPLSITVRNCVIENNEQGCLGVRPGGTRGKQMKGLVLIENCVFRQPAGTAIGLYNVWDKGVKVKFRNCVCELTGASEQTFCAFVTQDSGVFNGVDFGKFLVKYNCPPKEFEAHWHGKVKLSKPKGTVIFMDSKSGKKDKYDMNRLQRVAQGK